MKNIFYLLSIAVLLTACEKSPKDFDLKNLEGYWEIDKAETPFGAKEYQVNTTVDYFHLEDSAGFRKKVQPQLIGKDKASNDQEEFSLKYDDDSLRVIYDNQFDQWRETIIELTEEKLVVKNDSSFYYIYKRFKPIEIEE